MSTKPNPVRPLDAVDHAIIRLLQRDARTTNAELARVAGVAPSTAHARVRALVEDGVIAGFHAHIATAAMGLAIEALISVVIRAGSRDAIPTFLARVEGFPEVRQAFFLGGSEDFILHIAVPDVDAVRRFVVESLSNDPAVASTRTSLVFDHFHTDADTV